MGPPSVIFSGYPWIKRAGCEVDYLVSRLRISGALPLLPYVSSWRGRRQLYRTYVAPDKFEQVARTMRSDVSKNVDLRGIRLKKTYIMPWLMCVFVYRYMYFVYLYLFILLIYLLNHSFSLLFIYVSILFTCLFVRSSFVRSTVRWFIY